MPTNDWPIRELIPLQTSLLQPKWLEPHTKIRTSSVPRVNIAALFKLRPLDQARLKTTDRATPFRVRPSTDPSKTRAMPVNRTHSKVASLAQTLPRTRVVRDLEAPVRAPLLFSVMINQTTREAIITV